MADFEHLIAATGGLQAVIHNNQAKMGVEIKTIQDGQEGIKSGQAEMKVIVNAILQKMNSWQEEMKICPVEVEAMDLEANPEEKETVVEHK
jgi:hypothetical protein